MIYDWVLISVLVSSHLSKPKPCLELPWDQCQRPEALEVYGGLNLLQNFGPETHCKCADDRDRRPESEDFNQHTGT